MPVDIIIISTGKKRVKFLQGLAQPLSGLLIQQTLDFLGNGDTLGGVMSGHDVGRIADLGFYLYPWRRHGNTVRHPHTSLPFPSIRDGR